MTNKDNVTTRIPAKRYLTLDEMCAVVGISSKQFAAWQRDYGHVGYGGQHYTRLNVLKVMQLKATFAPYVDAFTHNFVDDAGDPAIDSQQDKKKLGKKLESIDKVLTLAAIVEQAS